MLNAGYFIAMNGYRLKMAPRENRPMFIAATLAFSGIAGGLAATDPKLVPYGAMTATFYTGLGCLLGPSVIFLLIRLIVE